jgi:hypothetical protein
MRRERLSLKTINGEAIAYKDHIKALVIQQEEMLIL